MSKLEAPTSLVINSMENIELPGECICNVNITFNYNGKLEGATYGTLRISDTNDNSKAQYDSYNSNVKIEKGENTRTASITNFKAVSGKILLFTQKILFSMFYVQNNFTGKNFICIQCQIGERNSSFKTSLGFQVLLRCRFFFQW